MKTFIYNLGYFFREAIRTIKSNVLSNFISVIGTGLILFILGMVTSITYIGNEFVAKLEQEAEINAYYKEGLTSADIIELTDIISNIDGVREARLVGEEEAKSYIEGMLGEESKILELFDENPFTAFIEVRINLSTMDNVVLEISRLDNIDYVRDNKGVLSQLNGIIRGIEIFGALIIIAVGITTLIIIAHLIRQGIYNNKEQINTLRLLGASEVFIGFPYVLVGLILTLIGGLIGTILLIILINGSYDVLVNGFLFLPLPDRGLMVRYITVFIMGISFILGLLGSLFGLSSIGKNK